MNHLPAVEAGPKDQVINGTLCDTSAGPRGSDVKGKVESAVCIWSVMFRKLRIYAQASSLWLKCC